MQKTFNRAAVLLVGLSMTAAALPLHADIAERSLVGVRLWRTWKDVLRLHGQPTRIEIGAVTAPNSSATAAGSGLMGAGPTGAPMGGKMGGMMGGGKMGAMSMPGMSGMGATAGGSQYGGGGMGMEQMMQARSGQPAAGMTAMGSMGGGAGGQGLGGFGAAGGGAATGLGGATQDDPNAGEITWVYVRGANQYMFLFNKDGRVIQIQEFGYAGGGATAHHVALGDALAKVYRAYGWPDKSEKTGNNLTLDYTQKHHVAIQLLDNGKGAKVVGIVVAITERSQIPGP